MEKKMFRDLVPGNSLYLVDMSLLTLTKQFVSSVRRVENRKLLHIESGDMEFIAGYDSKDCMVSYGVFFIDKDEADEYRKFLIDDEIRKIDCKIKNLEENRLRMIKMKHYYEED